MSNIKFSSTRLTEARQEMMMTISSLATVSGVSRITLSKLENGALVTPSTETVFSIAMALRKSTDYFYPQHEVTMKNVTVPTFRSMKTKSKWAYDQTIKFLEHCKLVMQCMYEYINPRYLDIDEDILNFFDPLEDDLSSIEHVSEMLRERWNAGDGVLLKLITLLENHGVICVPCHLPDKIDSINVAFKHSDDDPGMITLVLYNQGLNYFRQRFSLAHELGHIVLHHDLAVEEYEENLDLLERQANRFASAFLMPMDSFKMTRGELTISGALRLKDKWDVSAQAIVRRFLDTGLINESRFTYLQTEVARKGWRKREPGDNKVEQEKPYYMSSACSFILDNKLASPADFISYGSLPVNEIVSYVNNADKFLPTEPEIDFQVVRFNSFVK